jgi:uncharacterized protein
MQKIEKIIKKHPEGTIFNLNVTPNSQKIIFPAGINSWRKSIGIRVTASAKENRANKEVIKTVADFFEKPVSDIFIISGSKKKTKTIIVKNTSFEHVSERLKESFNGL